MWGLLAVDADSGVTAGLSGDVSALVDVAGINRAAGHLAAVEARLAASEAELETAERAVADARLALAGLVERAAGGDAPLTREAVAEAHAKARDAQHYSTACSAVVSRLRSMKDRADAALADAKARGWDAVLRRGIEFRIEAGRIMDRARVEAPDGTRAHELEARHAFFAARAEEARGPFEEGNRLVNLALANGGRMPQGAAYLPDFEGITERGERQHWRLPAGAAEVPAGAV